MLEFTSEVGTFLVWLTHASILLIIAKVSAHKTYEWKTATLIYLFYSIAPLISFEVNIFSLNISYTPSTFYLFLYVITDLFFLFLIEVFSRKKNSTELYLCISKVDLRYGCMLLVILSLIAWLNNIILNFDLILLPKHEFIGQLSENFVSNLIYFHIPADEILAGALIFNPFKNRYLKRFVFFVGILALCISVFQGYRHLIFALTFVALFKYRPKTSIILTLIIITIAGELSNPIKYMIASMVLDPDFELLNYIIYQTTNPSNFIWISGEQLAVFSNLIIGGNHTNYLRAFQELLNILPFFGRFTFDLQTGADGIGKIVGVGTGQGAGYNFQLFLIETFFIGIFFLFLAFAIIKIFSRTLLSVFSIVILFSIMRNTPAFWAGQIKMIFVLYCFMFIFNFLIVKMILKKSDITIPNLKIETCH